jgi:hypothetical protein
MEEVVEWQAVLVMNNLQEDREEQEVEVMDLNVVVNQDNLAKQLEEQEVVVEFSGVEQFIVKALQEQQELL